MTAAASSACCLLLLLLCLLLPSELSQRSRVCDTTVVTAVCTEKPTFGIDLLSVVPPRTKLGANDRSRKSNKTRMSQSQPVRPHTKKFPIDQLLRFQGFGLCPLNPH